jgi:hypothetical protein
MADIEAEMRPLPKTPQQRAAMRRHMLAIMAYEGGSEGVRGVVALQGQFVLAGQDVTLTKA